jgi:hypothetical protein
LKVSAGPVVCSGTQQYRDKAAERERERERDSDRESLRERERETRREKQSFEIGSSISLQGREIFREENSQAPMLFSLRRGEISPSERLGGFGEARL